MAKCGLIERIISVLGLDMTGSKMKSTPSERKPLVKDTDGPPCEESFSYASIVRMLLYLSRHNRPDITYAVNCAARYTFCPRKMHQVAFKRIGWYLLLTRDKGMILNPSKELNVDAYPDADFAGINGY